MKMAINRRNFIQNLGLSAATLGFTEAAQANAILAYEINTVPKTPKVFNMSGFAAPKIPMVRIGVVGLGNRGSDAVPRLCQIAGVELAALCDLDTSKIAKQQQVIAKAGLPKAKEYTGLNGWKAMCENKDLDLIYITTPWSWHTPMAVYAMNNGKHAATEVSAAKTIDECWQLVETSERTKKHCTMLENCCYDFFEQMTLNMAQKGVFGELVHAEGAYIHNLLEQNFDKNQYSDNWRLRENSNRNGNLYPTHGLGPIAQCLNINRGDKMDHLVSISTNDFQMGKLAVEMAKKDPLYQEFVGKPFRGNMNTTIIKTNKGKTIMLQHDVTSTRPYSRIHLVSGTKGVAQKWPEPGKISLGHQWMSEKELKEIEVQYTTPLVKHIGEIAKAVGGHGGMDFIMDWRLIDCLRNGLPLDQDVYDAAAWSSVIQASEISVAKKGRTVDLPDFTRGAWTKNVPVSLELGLGEKTGVRKVNLEN
jgi:hypothetical protein